MNAKKIINEICKQHNVTIEEIKGNVKTQHLTDARCHIYYSLRKYGFSLRQIGKMLNRDHSNISRSGNWPEIHRKRYSKNPKILFLTRGRPKGHFLDENHPKKSAINPDDAHYRLEMEKRSDNLLRLLAMDLAKRT